MKKMNKDNKNKEGSEVTQYKEQQHLSREEVKMDE